jgi:hypothetical protein
LVIHARVLGFPWSEDSEPGTEVPSPRKMVRPPSGGQSCSRTEV